MHADDQGSHTTQTELTYCVGNARHFGPFQDPHQWNWHLKKKKMPEDRHAYANNEEKGKSELICSPGKVQVGNCIKQNNIQTSD